MSWFEGQRQTKKEKVEWKRCINEDLCLTVSKKDPNKHGWLNPNYHKFKKLPESKTICYQCYYKKGLDPNEYIVFSNGTVEQRKKWKPPEPQAWESIQHEDKGFLWGIRRSRQRTEKLAGSDTWICTKCGRKGDFWYFENTACPKDHTEQTQEDIGESEKRETFPLEEFGE